MNGLESCAISLQLALTPGHRWLRMMEAGEVSSHREIAKRDGVLTIGMSPTSAIKVAREAGNSHQLREEL